MNLYDSIEKSVAKHPDRTALKYFGQSVSYRRMLEMIEHAASGLHNIGVGSGDTVCMSLPTTPESIATLYALNKIGAVVSTIDVRFTARQVMDIVNRLQAKMLFIMNFSIKEMATVADKMCVERIVVMRGCEIFPQFVTTWYSMGDVFNGRRRAFRSCDKFMYWNRVLDATGVNSPRHEWPQDAAQMIYQTSGTTGSPKSVMVTAENVSVFEKSARVFYGSDNSDTVLCLIPIFALSGFTSTIHCPLSYGMTVDIVPIWKPKDFIKTIAKARPQYVVSVPSNWETIYHPANRKLDLSSLKKVVVAGDILKPNFEMNINEYLHQSGFQSDVTKIYGMTESVAPIAITWHQSPNKYKLGFSGTPVEELTVRIVDGEICVLHPTKMLGYYGDKEATDDLLRRHEDGTRWMHTGDCGYIDEDGNLYVTGRKKRMYVRYDGTKIYPAEIEEALMCCPEVIDCAVVGIEDKKHRQSSVPVACCTVRNRNGKSATIIKRYAERELPVQMRPEMIVLMEKMPMLENGKVDYQQLINKIKP